MVPRGGHLPRLQWIRAARRECREGIPATGHSSKSCAGPDVIACDIEEFKATVVKRIEAVVRREEEAKAPAKPDKPTREELLVFVNWADSDLPLAEAVREELNKREISYVEPMAVGKPEMTARTSSRTSPNAMR